MDRAATNRDRSRGRSSSRSSISTVRRFGCPRNEPPPAKRLGRGVSFEAGERHEHDYPSRIRCSHHGRVGAWFRRLPGGAERRGYRREHVVRCSYASEGRRSRERRQAARIVRHTGCARGSVGGGGPRVQDDGGSRAPDDLRQPPRRDDCERKLRGLVQPDLEHHRRHRADSRLWRHERRLARRSCRAFKTSSRAGTST